MISFCISYMRSIELSMSLADQVVDNGLLCRSVQYPVWKEFQSCYDQTSDEEIL